MKKILALTIAILGLLFNLANATEVQKMADTKEMEGIKNALNLYVQAAIEGNSKVAQPAFAMWATMSYAQDGKLITVPIQELYNYFDQTGPHPASYTIISSQIAVDVAVVSIESKFGNAKFDDMFTLVKDGNNWKIISKVYHLK